MKELKEKGGATGRSVPSESKIFKNIFK